MQYSETDICQNSLDDDSDYSPYLGAQEGGGGVQKEYHVGFLKDWFGDKNDWDKKSPSL